MIWLCFGCNQILQCVEERSDGSTADLLHDSILVAESVGMVWDLQSWVHPTNALFNEISALLFRLIQIQNSNRSQESQSEVFHAHISRATERRPKLAYDQPQPERTYSRIGSCSPPLFSKNCRSACSFFCSNVSKLPSAFSVKFSWAEMLKRDEWLLIAGARKQKHLLR